MPKPSQRSLRVLSEQDGMATVRVTEGKDVSEYRIQAIHSDFGRAFHVTRTAGKPSANSSRTYHVLLEEGQPASCSCPGGVYHGSCKHAAACRVLASRGVI